MKLTRDFAAENTENSGIYTFSVASSEPFERTDEKLGTYNEVLVISEEAINFVRLVDERCPFILEHDQTKQLGVVEKAYIADEKLYVDVKFSENGYAQRVLDDIKAGIRRNVSIGYMIEDYKIINDPQGGIPTMLVTKWQPYECSSVSCPADPTVGFQRSLEENKETTEETTETTSEETTTTEEEKTVCPNCGHNPCTCEEDKQRKIAEEEAKKREIEEAAKREEEAKLAAQKREAEIKEIRSLAELIDANELAEKFINENRSYNDFKEAVKEFKNTKERKLNVKENKTMKFSLTKALNMFTKNFKGNIEDTDEYKVIEENKRTLGINDADIVVTRANLRGFPDGSESLNQTDYRPDMYTENLRPQNVIAKTGCRVVDVDGPSISFSVATSGVNAGFVDVNGEIPSADMAWALKSLTPKKLGAYVEIDYKALLQDRPSVEGIITDDIVRGLDQAKDEAILVGDGNNNKPVGIIATSGVNEVPISSAFTLSGVYGFEKEIRDSNDYSEVLTWVMNSKNYYTYATTPYSATEQNRMLLEDGKIIGHDVVICNALNDNTIILGNFNELLVANFDGMRLKVVEDAALSRKQAVEVQAFEAMDCLVRRPKSFTVSKA